MDNNNGIQLFKTDQTNVIIPNISEEDAERQNKELESKDITGAISGKEVKTLLLPEESVIDERNYIFDLSGVEKISIFKKEVLKSLLVSRGMENAETDVSLYLYNNTGKLVKIGVGDRYKLERLVPIIKMHIFEDEVKIYKNFKRGMPLNEVKKRDITQFRLNL